MIFKDPKDGLWTFTGVHGLLLVAAFVFVGYLVGRFG